jgi:hypothetical protein
MCEPGEVRKRRDLTAASEPVAVFREPPYFCDQTFAIAGREGFRVRVLCGTSYKRKNQQNKRFVSMKTKYHVYIHGEVFWTQIESIPQQQAV